MLTIRGLDETTHVFRSNQNRTDDKYFYEDNKVPIDLESSIATNSGAEGRRLEWLRIAAKRKKLSAGSAGAVVTLGLVLFAILPNYYTATTVVLPPPPTSNAATSFLNQLGNIGAMASSGSPLGIKNPNDQQVSFLKSKTVETAMVNRFHLQDVYHTRHISSACKKWESHSTTDSGLKDGLIRLSVTDSDATRAAVLVNAWVEEYRRFTATLAITEASQRRLFYETQLDVAKESLAKAEEALKQIQQRTGVIDIDGQDKAMLASAAVLRAQLAAKQVAIRAIKQFASERNPDLQRAQEEASGMEAQLAAMDVQNDRHSGDVIVPKGNISQDALDYLRAMREVKYREAVLDLITRQYEGARVDEARQGAIIQVVDPATVPDKPASHYRLWILIGALILATPISLGIARLAEAGSAICATYKNSDSLITAVEKTWFRFFPAEIEELTIN